MLRAGHRFPSEIIDHEPRVATFAARREAFLLPLIDRRVRRLAPGAVATEVECFASTCRVVVTPEGVTIDQMNEIVVDLQQAPTLADGVQPLDEGDLPDPRLVFILVYGPALRDHQRFEAQVTGGSP